MSVEAQQTESIKTQNSQETVASSKKPLIIGMVFGSLLIAIVVLTLIFTGVLSTSIPDNSASEDNNLSAVVDTDSTPVASAEPVVTGDDDQPPDGINTIDEPLVSASQDSSRDSEQATISEPVESAPEANPETEAAITYEDFRQESQTTLYRETND